jgi:predicted hotdog family 3-hydroxylacyl-ACP dehydratase
MLTRDRILDLIPHKGASFLLDHVVEHSRTAIACVALSHLDPTNPLRKDGCLGPVCGVEYGLQAAALHGALADGDDPQRVGYMASLRGVEFSTSRLDDPAHGHLRVEAVLEGGDSAGKIYSFRLSTSAGEILVTGRGTIVFTKHEVLAA